MKKTVIILAISVILTAVLFSCGGGGGGADNAIKEIFTISYNANGAEYGVAPAKQSGDEDSPQAVQTNTGNLSKSGYLFDGWNTAADGSGTNYAPGASYKGKNVTLYAKWAAIFNVQVINPGSPAPALNGVQRAPGVPYIKITGLTAKGKTLANINIPSTIDGYQVVSIGTGAFQGCDSVTELIIPNTVTSIENNAFSGCIGLSTMTIPSSVTTIGDGAFSDCAGLNSLIMLTATPPAMGAGAFEGCTATVSVPAAGVDDYKAAEGWNTYSASIAGYSNEIHTVTFDSQGATTGANPASIAVEPPNVTVGELPVAPKRTGYIFGGWFKGEGGTGEAFTASTVVSSNMTVYAKWESYEYTVTFDDQGATIPTSPTSKTVASPNTTVDSLPSEPENTGYYFGGWNTKADGTGTVFTASTPVTGNIEVYAVWLNNPTRTVTFDGQGATTEADPPTKQVVSPAVTIDSLPTAPKKTGYNFGGWFRNQDGTGGEFNTSSVVSEDITVYAKWIPIYIVSYNGNGNTGGSTPTRQEANSGSSINLRTNYGNLSKTGYSFSGWNTKSDGSGISYAEGELYTVTESITLYSKWIINNYTVTYDGNGNTSGSAPSSQSADYNSNITLPNGNNLEKTGYIFSGWNTRSDGAGAGNYAAGANYKVTRDITLYAKWLENGLLYCEYETNGNEITITGLNSEGVAYINEAHIEAYITHIVIPSKIDGKNVTCIKANFLESQYLTIPKTVTSITNSDFGYKHLGTIATYVEDSNSNFSSTDGILYNKQHTTLIRCPQDKSGRVTIPDTVKTIEVAAFNQCHNLTEINIPDSVTSIGGDAFRECTNISEIIIPDKASGTLTIYSGAFFGCSNLTSVTLGKGVVLDQNSAQWFYGCYKLSEIISANSVDGVLYRGKELMVFPPGKLKETTEVVIPDGITTIHWAAFMSLGITGITLPDTLTTIGESAFSSSSLRNIIIPSSITTIGHAAFSACQNLESVRVEKTTPPTGAQYMFDSCPNLTIYVPTSAVNAYKTAALWKNYANKIVGY